MAQRLWLKNEIRERWIDETNVRRAIKELGEKICLSAGLSIIIPTWTGLGWSPDFGSERPTPDSLSHGIDRWNYYYYYYYYYYYLLLTYLLQFICHLVAVVLTLVQTKQIRLNIHKRNNTKNTKQTIKNTVNTGKHITKTPTHYRTHTYL